MFEFIMEDMIDAVRYIPAGAAAGLLVCAILCFRACVKNRHCRHGSERRWKPPYAAAFLMTVYLVVLSWLVFFNREVGSRDGVTLELFGTIGRGIRGNSFVTENIMLFVPFGILAPFVWPVFRRGWLCVPFGAACSVAIEGVQYLTKRGYCQLDDVVMNTAGMLIGWIVYRIFRCFSFHCRI